MIELRRGGIPKYSTESRIGFPVKANDAIGQEPESDREA